VQRLFSVFHCWLVCCWLPMMSEDVSRPPRWVLPISHWPRGCFRGQLHWGEDLVRVFMLTFLIHKSIVFHSDFLAHLPDTLEIHLSTFNITWLASS
jgi:hypothetical protein